MQGWSTHSLASFAVMLCIAVPDGFGQVLDAEVLRFDMGSTAYVASHHIAVPASSVYDSERGYGWLGEGLTDYDRPNLLRSRDARVRDGVRSSRLAFQANVAAGVWHVLFWMEAGMQDSSTVVFRVNGQREDIAWQTFNPPAEPRHAPQPLYRAHQTQVRVADQGLTLEWTNGADDVAVMAVVIVAAATPATAAERALMTQLQRAGQYPVTTDLAPLHRRIEAAVSADPTDPFATYWDEQLATLIQAEHYLEDMRGWEWANDSTGLPIFQRYHQVVMWLDGLVAGVDPTTFPLHARAIWQRGRILYWLHEERGGPNERRGARRDLATLYAQYPDDPLLAMYLGANIDTPDPCDYLPAVPVAPAWAISQREVMCRLRQIAHWWVNERQAPNGELGGKIGDDVEMLRWWAPLVLAGDTTTLRGWQRLAEAVWNSPQLEDGYHRAPIDVEHAAEPIADTVPLLALVSDEPLYLERLRYSVDHFKDTWTLRLPNGHRYFRSAWFGANRIDERPPRNRDLEMNTRATKAVRYYASLTQDAEVIAALHEWARAWAAAAMRTDKGKPAGLIPASVRGTDEALNGDEPTWHQANMFWRYFNWPQADGSKMLDQLLFTYTLTGDTTLLTPFHATLDLVRAHATTTTNAAPGSAAWAAQVLRRKRGFWSVIGQWRLLTGDTRYDDLLLAYGTPYLRYRLTGDEGHLATITGGILNKVRYNWPLVTSEPFVTDRVYITPRIRRGTSRGELQAMFTGDANGEGASPYLAASWENTSDGFAALITDTGTQQLGVDVFLFDDAETTVTLRLWQLASGTYALRLTDRAGSVVYESNVSVEQRGQRVALPLPARRLVHLHLTPAL